MNNYNKECASRLSELVNNFSFDPRATAKEMTKEHKTLQQNFTRLCFAWISEVATNPYYSVDDRNRATQVKCKAIHDAMSNDPAWDHLPYI